MKVSKIQKVRKVSTVKRLGTLAIKNFTRFLFYFSRWFGKSPSMPEGDRELPEIKLNTKTCHAATFSSNTDPPQGTLAKPTKLYRSELS